MKLDILAFGAHPDDVELSASGTLILQVQKGYKCGIVDLTRGELGTRGNPDLRENEAKKATAVMGIHARENLGMEDGFFQNDRENQLKIAAVIRKYRPEIILSNAIMDRHPDHSRASALVNVAVFLAGLSKVKLSSGENTQLERWKTKAHYHYIQDRYIKPDFVVDISSTWEKKMESILAFSSQFYNPGSDETETEISSKDFVDFLKARAVEMARPIGVQYAEGFVAGRTPAVNDLFRLI